MFLVGQTVWVVGGGRGGEAVNVVELLERFTRSSLPLYLSANVLLDVTLEAEGPTHWNQAT